MSFQAKDSVCLGRQLKVQKVSIPFVVVANATPASKTASSDEPSMVFLRLEGVDQITEATGALASGETMPSGLVTLADSSGSFVALCKINEALAKVVSVKVVGRTGTAGLLKSCECLGFTSVGQSVVANVRTGISLATTTLDAVLEIEYVVAE